MFYFKIILLCYFWRTCVKKIFFVKLTKEMPYQHGQNMNSMNNVSSTSKCPVSSSLILASPADISLSAHENYKAIREIAIPSRFKMLKKICYERFKCFFVLFYQAKLRKCENKHMIFCCQRKWLKKKNLQIKQKAQGQIYQGHGPFSKRQRLRNGFIIEYRPQLNPYI